jgi:hypothetical protein
MQMRIIEARHNGLAGEIEHLGLRAKERLDDLNRADRHELAFGHGERLGARLSRVDRQNIGVTDDELSRLDGTRCRHGQAHPQTGDEK